MPTSNLSPPPESLPNTLTVEQVRRIYAFPTRADLRPQFKQNANRERARAIVARMSEGLRMIVPTWMQERFLSCRKKIRIAEGSARSVKTMAGAIEDARAVTGQDPHDKFPKTGKGLIVGLDWHPHIALIWEKLTCEGQFKTIRDERTGLMRAVRPDPTAPEFLDPYDDTYRERWKDGAPLIPPSAIKAKQMESTSPAIPRWARIETARSSYEVDFRSSRGEPIRGVHYNFAHFDEQLINEMFFYETMRALMRLHEPEKHTPRFWWTATSQIPTPQYFELCEKAYANDPNIAAFKFLVKDCPFFSEKEKQIYHDSLSEDVRRSLYYGEHAMGGQVIYPMFDPMGPHGCEPFKIPGDWCRYMSVDPGRQEFATLFFAVPPDQTQVFVYDGFVSRMQGALAWAADVASRQTDVRFEAFVIDQQAGKQHSMGSEDDEGVADKFWDALMAANVRPRQVCGARTAGFFPGTKDVRAREEALRGWMEIRSDGPAAGTAKLQIFRGLLPELEKQIRYARFNRDDPSKREKIKGRPQDLVEALEYFAHFDPGYHVPESLCPAPCANPKTVSDAWKDQVRYDRAQRQLAASF